MAQWWQEIRYGARVLRKSPGFTSVAVLSLALGIGVNTAVLAVARSVLIAPLPVTAPHELVIAQWWRGDQVRGLMSINSGTGKDERTGRALNTNFSYPMFTALRDAARDQADLFAFTFIRQANLAVEGQSVVGGGMLVSGGYFATVGVPMQAGRGIEPRDDRPEAAPVAVLGASLWRSAFGGDPSIVGRTVRVNGRPFTIVGITAPGYFGISNGGFFPPADITLPLSAQPLVSPRWNALMTQMNPPATGTLFSTERIQWLRVMGRQRPGVDRSGLETAMSAALLRHLEGSAMPVAGGAEPPLVRVHDGARGMDSMRSTLEKPLLMLGGVAALVFLIACVNVASLVLVRGVARQQEFWVRLALGAGRRRLVRQSIAESVLIAAAGGILGVVFAIWTGSVIVRTLAGSTPTAVDVRLEPWLLGLAGLVSGLAAALFGIFPALRMSSRESADMMRRTGAGAPRLRAGRVLVLVQVAVAVPLVVGAALFLRTIHNLTTVELGFEPRGLVQFRMDPTLNGYDEARSRQLYARVLERVGALPDVRGVTLVENALISGWTSGTQFESDADVKPEQMLMNRIGPGFFDTFGLPVVAGRGIGLQDHATAPRVAVLNEAAAAAFFGTANPLGRQVRFSRPATAGGAPLPSIEVVGVARDSKYQTLKGDAQPTIYLPYFQSAGLGAMHVVVRTASGEIAGQLQRAVAEVDPDIPVTAMKTQLQQIDETIGSERALTNLLVFFGLFALLLACIGLHGVTAYAVASRTSEIGIRLALGAQRGSVLWLVLRQVVLLAIGGLVIGIPAAAAGSRLVQSYLFGVQPADPVSITAGAAILFGVAVAAGYVPARRAARLDPLVALRRD